MVAEIDCTLEEAKELCNANGVRGFPTLKYGDPSNLDDYQGGRDFDSLSTFAKEHLKPICSPSNMEVCDDDKKAQIEAFMALPDAELDDKIAEYEKQSQDAEEHFKGEVEKLQATYQELVEEKDGKLAAVKDSGLGLLKSVKIAKAKASVTKEEL